MGTQPLEMNSQKVVFTVEAVVFFSVTAWQDSLLKGTVGFCKAVAEKTFQFPFLLCIPILIEKTPKVWV